MKIRSIRPEFFADPTMADLDPMARLLYIGLWCYVDDDGRGEWLPKQIDGLVFPLETVDIDALLAQLVRTARIVRYSDGDRDYFYIPTFTEYQRPNRKYDSKLPDPAEYVDAATVSASALPAQRVRTADAHAVEVEGEGDSEPSVHVPKRPPKGAGPRELAFHVVFEDGFGIPSNSELGLRRKIAQSLMAAGASPEDVVVRAEAWRKLFPAAAGRKSPTLTLPAIDKWWGQLGQIEMRKPFAPEECVHPEDRVAMIDGQAYCGMCRREL